MITKQTIQIVIKDHAREIEMQKDYIESLNIGDQIIPANIFNHSIINNQNDLANHEKMLNYFKKIQSEMEEPFFMVKEINKLDNGAWLQVIVVEPLYTIDKIFIQKIEKAKQDPSAFFISETKK